ncbi:MAG: hypothetical protein K0S53_1225 [Bacteroidetes bacterium]|jgi:hypothetical protein|nr:hypothetical protein [Bacteroidota bacterium]MDF2452309.1 hypothetical protein [Bacteroidota bacterium]
MKKICLLVFFLSVSSAFFAQLFFAGDTSCFYKKVNNSFIAGNGFSPGQHYHLDLNADGSSDIDFESIHVSCNTPSGPACAGTGQWEYKYFKLSSLTNVTFLFGPAVGSNCTFTNTIQNLSYGTPLNSNLNWNNTGSRFVYYYSLYSFPQQFCGQVVDSFYVGFRNISTNNDTINGWLLIDSHYPGKLISYGYKITPLNTSASFSLTQTSLCLGDSLHLDQIGTGYFNGFGVKNNVFFNDSVGNYKAYASNGCVNTSTLDITVFSLPNPPQITNSSTSICKGDSLVLSGNPGSGIFSGSGVSGNVFYSSNISTNTVSIQYTVSDQSGCSNTTTKNFSIAPLTFTMSTCLGSGFSLPTQFSMDGIFTGSGVYNGNIFDPNISGSGIIPVYFTSTCNKTATLNITVHPDPPKPQIINPATSCCLGDKIPLSGLPSGGYFGPQATQLVIVSDDTLYTEYFQPEILFYDTGKVVYFYAIQDINGCTSYAYDTIQVEYAYSPDSPINSCPHTTFSLTGFPNGGTFTGANIAGNTYTAPASIGSDLGYYSYTYSSGCSATYTLHLATYDCVGIEENLKNDQKILIYPNPTADFIQLDLVNINTENSYNAKIVSIEGAVLKSVLLDNNNNVIDLADLPNGIYFIDVSVDHSVYRSKLVIIR